MIAHRLASFVLAVGLLCAASTPAVRPALAGADVCPEPNNDPAAACFLGAGSSAPGFLDSADDVDTYRLELAPDSMIVATLGGLPADYGLRLQLADGTVKGEALEAGVADKVIRADALAPGTYYLSVLSPRGASDAEHPYLIGVSYPASIVLGNPAAPGAPSGAPTVPYGYIPSPAKAYGLLPSDVGAGFREVAQDAPEDGRRFRNRIVAPNAVPYQRIWVAENNIWMIDTSVFVQPYGSNDELTAEYSQLLATLRGQYGANVQPATGWGSEQVYSYAWAGRNPDAGVVVMYRGIALKHRNAIVFVAMLGLEQHATWDSLSRVVRAVESRLHAAVQQ